MTLDDNPPGGSQSDLPRPAPSSPFAKYYPLHINPENIFPVDPITRTFCFFGTRGFHQKVEETVARRIENARVLIQRLPTQDELDAMVTHSSRSVAYERKGIWIGALVYAGISLPRWARTERWRTYVPPTGSMVQRLAAGFKAFNKAEPLVARQRTMLAVFKLMFSMIAGASVSGVMGVYTETKNTVSDPRLAQFMADLRNQNPEEVQKRKAAAIESRRRQMHQRRLEEVPAVGDGQGGLEKEQGYASGGAEADSPQTATPGRVYQAVQDRRPVIDSSEGQSRGSYFFDDDDASPVAPEHRNTSLQDAGALQANSWERIRQQSMSGPTQKTRENIDQPPKDVWNSSDYSNPDASRQREQAQAEFDRLIEAERSLGNESSGSSGRKGWGKW
ncbi:endo-1,3(4)-beta-glucanase [Aspergillus terreus]|uniref:Endo-1,3(4)-beta-glucanase n=1 Tax=Aspergillus terreus TaxID=33178 RepID=A0A5M3Z9J7_ASPTE|nr:hypothetical protein ATETN484_0009051800 [Aspergillus terreus]GFF17969.1 endo-1,3(4)-beta-glucanase [Aspergillus terreus]